MKKRAANKEMSQRSRSFSLQGDESFENLYNTQNINKNLNATTSKTTKKMSKDIKKTALKLTLSCPNYYNTVLNSSLYMNVKENEESKSYLDYTKQHAIITKQPSKNYLTLNKECQVEVREQNELQRNMIGCLYRCKSVISCCTCYWCLNSLCYHCVSKDDIGYNDISIKQLCKCPNNSAKTNIKCCAIMTSCLPCIPLLTFYPILTGAVNSCIKLLS